MSGVAVRRLVVKGLALGFGVQVFDISIWVYTARSGLGFNLVNQNPVGSTMSVPGD